MKIFYDTTKEQGNILATVLDSDYSRYNNTIHITYAIIEIDEVDGNHDLIIRLSLASAPSNFYVKNSNQKLQEYYSGSWHQLNPAEYNNKKTKREIYDMLDDHENRIAALE